MPGFSECNLKYCLQFYAPSIGQQPVAQIPRGDNNLIFSEPRVKKKLELPESELKPPLEDISIRICGRGKKSSVPITCGVLVLPISP